MIDGELMQATQQLYEMFSRYARPERMETDGGVVTQMEEPELLATPLREIPIQAIDRYAVKAMTTWGDVDQFKYFLPRILELLAPGLDWGPEIILGKLDYAGWRSWSKGEQAAVENYCRSLWSHVLTTAGCKAGGFLAGFAQICDDLQWFLTEWAQQLPQSPEATHGLLEFVVLDVGDDERGFTLLWLDMVGDGAIARSTVESGQARRFKLGPWWEERGEQERQVLDWVFSPTTISSLEGACTAHRIESEYDLEWTLKQLRGSSELYRLNRNA